MQRGELRKEFMKKATKVTMLVASFVALTAAGTSYYAAGANEPANLAPENAAATQSIAAQKINPEASFMFQSIEPAAGDKAPATAAPLPAAETLAFVDISSKELGQKHPFLQPTIDLEDDYYGKFFPDHIRLAETKDAVTGTEYIFLLNTNDTCDQEQGCGLQVYAKTTAEKEFRLVHATLGLAPVLMQREEKAFSLLVCGLDGSFTKWTMQDGALAKAPPQDAYGYFTPQAVPAATPNLPKCGK